MSWRETRLTALMGLSIPVIQGPFGGGLSSSALAAEVANAGGLGSYGAHHLSPAAILDISNEIRAQTRGAFAINLWVSDRDPGGESMTRQEYERNRVWLEPYCEELGIEMPDFPDKVGQDVSDQVEAVLEAGPPVFSFVYGVPGRAILQRCRKRGILTLGTATSVDEARVLEAAGVDAIVASGLEAGGHRVSFLRPAEESLIGTFALIPRVVDRVTVPVVAAGGIGDGRGLLSALTLGAQAAQIGTAFLACEESGATPIHREKLFSPEAADTVLTRAFTGRLARGIRNRFTQEMAEWSTAPYPIQSWFSGHLKGPAVRQGRWELMALWAGQAAPLIRHRRAREVIDHLVREVERLLQSR